MRRLTKSDYGASVKFNTCDGDTTCIKCNTHCVLSIPSDGYIIGTIHSIEPGEKEYQNVYVKVAYAQFSLCISTKYLTFLYTQPEHVVEIMF